MKRILSRFLLICWAISPASFADGLSEPPPAWSGRLLPLPEQSFGPMDTAAAERLRDTRAELARALTEGGAGASESDLAPGFGRLGALYAAGRLWAGADRAFENARRLDPGDVRWVYYGAHLALDAGEAEQALQRLEQVRALDPEYPTLSLRTGEALLGLNRLAEAERAYTEALERHPAQRAAALYGLAQIDLLQRRWQAAADRLAEVLRLQPQADAAHYGLGQALLRLGEREQAQSHLGQRGTARPAYPDPLVEQLTDLQSGARHHFEQAMSAVNEEDYPRAIPAFEAGLAVQPKNARARTSYARALWLHGRAGEAVEQLQISTRDDPEETLAPFLLAAIADGEGRSDSAAQGYREVIRRDPDHLGALSYLADLQLRGGHAGAAVELYRRAVELDAQQSALRMNLWRALVESGAPQAELRDALEGFDQRFPEPPVFRRLLARLLATSPEPAVRDTGRALQLAAELINAMPIAPHQELLALVLAARGEWEQAVERQSLLVEHTGQGGPPQLAAVLKDTLEAYRAGRLPEQVWRLELAAAQPAGVDVSRLMRLYPAARPF